MGHWRTKKDEHEINTTSETSCICVYNIYIYTKVCKCSMLFPLSLTLYHPCLALTGVQAPPRTCQAHVSIIWQTENWKRTSRASWAPEKWWPKNKIPHESRRNDHFVHQPEMRSYWNQVIVMIEIAVPLLHPDTQIQSIENLQKQSAIWTIYLEHSKPIDHQSQQIPHRFQSHSSFLIVFSPPPKEQNTVDVPIGPHGLQWPLGPLWALKTAQIRGLQDQVGIPHFLFLNSLFGLWKKSQNIQKKIDFRKSPSKKAMTPPHAALSCTSLFPCRLCGCIIARSNAPQMCFGWGFKATNNKHPKNCAKPSNSVEVSGWIMLNYYLKKTAIPLWEEKCTTFFLVSHVRSFEFHSNTLIKYIYIYISFKIS